MSFISAIRSIKTVSALINYHHTNVPCYPDIQSNLIVWDGKIEWIRLIEGLTKIHQVFISVHLVFLNYCTNTINMSVCISDEMKNKLLRTCFTNTIQVLVKIYDKMYDRDWWAG